MKERYYTYLWTSERDDWAGWELVSDDGEWREWRRDITDDFVRAFGSSVSQGDHG
jgi:hypothetical protein